MSRTVRVRNRLRRLAVAALPPPQTDKHREDRLKALSGAAQTAALSVIGIGVFTPLLASHSPASIGRIVAVFGIGAVIEALSLTFLLYIPYPQSAEDRSNG